jgi:hypothetical protein
MKRAVAASLIFFAACASSRDTGTTAVPGHGAISVQVIPNPIVAKSAGGNMYDFPFEVVVRETGGRGVTINRVTADVFAFGGIQVASETYSAEQIRALGYATNIPGNGELRYRFSPRKSVPNEGLFNGVSAQVRVNAYDETNTPATAAVNVTVTK